MKIKGITEPTKGVDFSIKSGEVRAGNRSTTLSFDDILLKSKLLIFTNEDNSLHLMDKVGGTGEKINDHESFLLPLDYSDKLRKLLYVRVKDIGDKSGTDVLFEFDRNTLKKTVVGKGSPIVDACFQK